jgi:hypothetical protein
MAVKDWSLEALMVVAVEEQVQLVQILLVQILAVMAVQVLLHL